MLNGCNARIMSLDLGGAPMWQIGAEGGLFRGLEGRRLVVRNRTPVAPVSALARPLPTVMQIRVGTSVTHRGPRGGPRDLPGQAARLGRVRRHQVRPGPPVPPGRDRGGLGLHDRPGQSFTVLPR